MATHDEICETIAAAFADAEMPCSEKDLTTGGIDGPYAVEHFLGKRQVDVESHFLPSLHMEDFSYMTTRAVAYYLPAVLRLMMKTPYDSELWIFLHGFLKPREGRYAPGVRELEPRQLQAISEWASYLHDEWHANPPALIDPRDALKLVAAYRQ
ncbi:hypothetical protein [Hyalangium versicolor]|uniref:hypothetical protein n=1 Tax=Hyalangium versicolor TaxID=2861190 RepID=UPI001CCB3A96|nr:hypothetical protein [Hyalangium versicolor]